MKRILIAATFGVTVLGLAASASAQLGRIDSRAASRRHADVVYRSAACRLRQRISGRAQRGTEGKPAPPRVLMRDEKTYQRADKGYHREYGDRERYRQSFRAGYADGYAEAYRRFGYGNGRGNRGVGIGQGRYGQGGYGQGGYGQGGYGQGGYGYGYNGAFQYGAQDGYEKGLEDASKRRSHDVLRHSWYRGGDRHYNSRYGSRQQYADLYRQGFREGYERGYRGGYR
jgi:hypothetical protein